jgi:hypothetical protein
MFKKVGIYVCRFNYGRHISYFSSNSCYAIRHRYKRHRCVQAHTICRSEEITLEDVQYSPDNT